MIKSVDTFCFIMFTKSDEINTLSDIINLKGVNWFESRHYIDLKDKTGLSKNKSELKVTVFDDLVIDLNDIFKHVK